MLSCPIKERYLHSKSYIISYPSLAPLPFVNSLPVTYQMDEVGVKIYLISH
jgi:hypothetical protein